MTATYSQWGKVMERKQFQCLEEPGNIVSMRLSLDQELDRETPTEYTFMEMMSARQQHRLIYVDLSLNTTSVAELTVCYCRLFRYVL
jgi:hypothetical protein